MKFFQKTKEEGTFLKTLQEACHHHDNPHQRYLQKRKLQANIFDEYRCKNSLQSISKLYPTAHKKVIHHNLAGVLPSSQGWINIYKSINVVHTSTTKKPHMITSVDADKTYDKFQHSFMIKYFTKVGIDGTYLNIIKVIYDKPIANIIMMKI